MLKRLEDTTKNSYCVKTWTIAGHGRVSLDVDPSVNRSGDGDLTNDKDGNGNRIGSGVPDVTPDFIKIFDNCVTQIHSPRIFALFTRELADAADGKVVSAASACFVGGNRWIGGPCDCLAKENQSGKYSGFIQKVEESSIQNTVYNL